MIIKKTKELKIFNFINKIYHINEQISSVSRKKNKKIKIKGSTIAKLLFMGMFFREKSINQIMEKTHYRKKFSKFFSKRDKLPKMHGFRDGIIDLNVDDLERINKNIIVKARENKVYRKGTIDGLVVVGIDGTESFGSYKKNWNNSYKNTIKNQKIINGKKEIIEEEYHKQINVFAKLVGMRPGLLLSYEKITCNGNSGKQEYEPNVAIKLVEKLKKIYGRGIDVIVGDAIYLQENFVKAIIRENYIGVLRLKDNNKGLIINADGVFSIIKAQKYKYKNKMIEYWSDIFEYKKQPIKIVKYIEYEKQKKDTIYVMCTDLDLNEKTINKIIHARWDIENEGFNELKNYWNMNHCFIANENAIDVIMQTIMISYNLWELYLYGHLHDFEKSKITKLGYIEEIKERVLIAKKKELFFSSA